MKGNDIHRVFSTGRFSVKFYNDTFITVWISIKSIVFELLKEETDFFLTFYLMYSATLIRLKQNAIALYDIPSQRILTCVCH